MLRVRHGAHRPVIEVSLSHTTTSRATLDTNPYLEEGGEARVYGRLHIQLVDGPNLRLREAGNRKKPIGAREFRRWLEGQGGALDQDAWLLPLRARDRVTKALRKFLKGCEPSSKEKRLGDCLLAALQDMPPGEHYGDQVPSYMSGLIKRILGELRSGAGQDALPWLRADRPQNGVDRRPYRGFNRFALQFERRASPFWYTKKQVRTQGGCIRPGERPTTVVMMKRSASNYNEPELKPTEELDDYDVATALMKSRLANWSAGRVTRWRGHKVYNWTQIEGIPEPARKDRGGADADPPLERAESVVRDYLARSGAPELVTKGSFAFYQWGENSRRSHDRIVVPPVGQFKTRAGYYRVLFHEMAHSTGHPTRLNRHGVRARATDGRPYHSHEELVADMTAAWLMADLGLEAEAERAFDPVAYCQAWHAYLSRDPAALWSAAWFAQRAADWIRGVEAPAPTARTNALQWLVEHATAVSGVRPMSGSRGKSVVALSLVDRKTPLYVKTKTGRGDPLGGYAFWLDAKDVKTWRASSGKRTSADLHGLLLIPENPDRTFDPTVAPPVLLRLERLREAGLRFNTFKGFGGKKARVAIILTRPRGRKSWVLTVETLSAPLRLGVGEVLSAGEP